MDQIIKEDLEKIRESLVEFKEKIENKTFLITGGAGFLGSWFSDIVILFNGKVICVDNLASGSIKNINHLLEGPNFEFIEKNYLDYEPSRKVDYIVNMASIATPPLYMKFPIETLDSNILGVKKLLELSIKDSVSGILQMSTSEIYGNPPDEMIPTPEDYQGLVNCFGPRSMYDEGKRAAEAYCYSFFTEHKVPIRLSRTFNTYGPRLDVEGTSQYGRALVKFIDQALNDKTITIYGDGRQTRSFCYITDQIEGLFRLLLTEDINGEAFNIGNTQEFTINKLASMIIDNSNSNSKLVVGSPPDYDLQDDPRRRSPIISKATERIGYNPKVNLESGLKRIINWMKIINN